MNIRARYFAYFREQLGRSQDRFDMPEGCTARELWLRCAEGHDTLIAAWDSVLVAVNGEYAGHETVLHEGDEVTFLPPVSGGSDRCRLVCDRIDVRALEAEVVDARHGAVVTFVGVVRETSDSGKLVRYLEYEAYDEMALHEMEAIARQVEERWPGSRIAIEHRIGRLEIGEASVAIAVATAHRAAAFEACRFTIDRLKQTVPIWKKEVFLDGEAWVGVGA
jgi:molybdopterin converting factor subunit 1